jgi:hypothetical protein
VARARQRNSGETRARKRVQGEAEGIARLQVSSIGEGSMTRTTTVVTVGRGLKGTSERKISDWSAVGPNWKRAAVAW